MISRNTDIKSALRSRQRGMLLNPFRFNTVGGDPDFASVAMLMHFDGTDASTTFTDNSSLGKTWTANGNAQIDTAQSVFGGASGLFDGTGDYITTPDYAELSIGSGDFIVEGRVRLNGAASTQFIIGQCGPAGTNDTVSFAVARNSSNSLTAFCCAGSTAIGELSSSALTAGVWYEWSYSKQGTVYRLALNGVVSATKTQGGTVNDSAFNLSIGRLGEFNNLYFNGHLDEMRLTIGTSRYTFPYTPNASAFPNL